MPGRRNKRENRAKKTGDYITLSRIAFSLVILAVVTEAVVGASEKRYLMTVSESLPLEQARQIGIENGLEFVRELNLIGDKRHFIFKLAAGSNATTNKDNAAFAAGTSDSEDSTALVTTIVGHAGVIGFEVDEYVEIYGRTAPTINDPQWSNMWYLQSTTSPSMGVYEAWSQGYSGSGITVSVTDDGIERTHTDLSGKYQSHLSYDYVYSDAIPDHSSGETHGTNCAGIVAAERNTDCIIGIAYDANLAAVKILDAYQSSTVSSVASTLTHSLSSIDIYSNSWGPGDSADTFSSLYALIETAFITGVTTGRGGKGVIYTWASGNGGQNGDDCNCDGYTNSIYTIAVASVSNTGAPAFYAEQCTAILAATYGGDSPNPQIYTTHTSDTCTSSFQGTSAATPVASGIIALLLQARPDLTWRDVQHLIVETSSFSGLYDPNGFTRNAASKYVSRYFGFGLMNANSLVSRTSTWVAVSSQITCTESTVTPSISGTTQLESTHVVSTCSVAYLEHVRVTITFRGDTRGKIQFFLVSPGGTTSQILHARAPDTTTMSSFETFTFMSVHTWRESPTGTWTLRMYSSDSSINLYLNSWQLILYGTETDPVQDAASASDNTAYPHNAWLADDIWNVSEFPIATIAALISIVGALAFVAVIIGSLVCAAKSKRTVVPA